MQKKITATRGHIDALQSQVKFLEEAMTSAAKVTRTPYTGIYLRSIQRHSSLEKCMAKPSTNFDESQALNRL